VGGGRHCLVGCRPRRAKCSGLQVVPTSRLTANEPRAGAQLRVRTRCWVQGIVRGCGMMMWDLSCPLFPQKALCLSAPIRWPCEPGRVCARFPSASAVDSERAVLGRGARRGRCGGGEPAAVTPGAEQRPPQPKCALVPCGVCQVPGTAQWEEGAARDLRAVPIRSDGSPEGGLAQPSVASLSVSGGWACVAPHCDRSAT
jgi:hypothetical protein